MADLKYTVTVDVGQASATLNKLNGNIKQVSDTASGLSNVFNTLITGAAIVGLVKFADSVANVRNRLLQISPSLDNANQQFQAIAGIAINSRAPLEAVGDLYFRIARAADTLGISQKEAAAITESVAKSISASGMSAQEAAGPLLQLGQALQSGTFQGDELRSILEGMPSVARALAAELQVPIGALKKLGSEGQITGEVFVRAMRRARDSIEQDFARTIPTISQAFTNLQTQLQLSFAQFENNTQTSQNFALAIEYIGLQIFRLSKNIDAIIEPLGTFVKIVGTLVVFSVAGRIISLFVRTIQGLVTGLLFVAYNIREVVTRTGQFAEILAAAGKNAVGLAGTLSFILAPLGRLLTLLGSIGAAAAAFVGLDKLFDWFQNLGKNNSDARKELEAYRKELSEFQNNLPSDAKEAPAFIDPTVISKARDELEKITRGYLEATSTKQRQLEIENSLIGAVEKQQQVTRALRDIELDYFNTLNNLMEEYRKVVNSTKAEDQERLKIVEQQIQAVTEAYDSQISVIKELTEENFNLNEAYKQRQALSDFTLNTELDLARKIREIQHQIATSTMTDIEKKYEDIRFAAKESAQAAIDTENSRRRSAGIAKMTAEEEKKYRDAAIAGTEKLIAAQEKADAKSREFSTGWKKAMGEYVDAATNAANRAQDIFRKATQGMEDLIVDFAKTGKFEWKKFVASMLEELLRAEIQTIFASLLGGMRGQIGSGGPTSALGGITDLLGGGLESITRGIGGIFGSKPGDGGFWDSISGGINKLFGLGGGGAGGAQGASANNPLYVLDVGGGFSGGGFGSVNAGTGGAQKPTSILDSISNTATKVWTGIKDVGSKVWDGVKAVGSGVWDGIKAVGSSVWEGAKAVGSGLMGALGSVGDFFAGFFANGGMIPAGKFGVVGEAGPEFVSGPATVTPMSGSTNVTYNINAVDAMSFKQMLAQDPSFIYGLTLQGSKGVPARR